MEHFSHSLQLGCLLLTRTKYWHQGDIIKPIFFQRKHFALSSSIIYYFFLLGFHSIHISHRSVAAQPRIDVRPKHWCHRSSSELRNATSETARWVSPSHGRPAISMGTAVDSSSQKFCFSFSPLFCSLPSGLSHRHARDIYKHGLISWEIFGSFFLCLPSVSECAPPSSGNRHP